MTRWIKNGILFVCDIFDSEGNMDYQKLYSKVPNNAITQLELNCVANALQCYNGAKIHQLAEYDLVCFGEKLASTTTNQIRHFLVKKLSLPRALPDR